MAADDLRTMIGDIRQTLLAGHEQGPSDGQLLTRFLEQRDGAALAALVRRHAPMVWGVCRRALRNADDAEDAFQATFLVLVRRAGSIRPREMVANYLYGVARQTARKARAAAARRALRERQVDRMPEPRVKHGPRDDLRPFLDEELGRLPAKYRAVLVLCDLEGRPRPAAARCLGLPEGTVASRLARARAMLAKRLVRRGVAVTAGALAAALAAEAAAAPPAPLVSAAVRAVCAAASGQVGGAVVSAQVAALTDGVLKTMFLTPLKKVLAGVLALGVTAIACGVLAVVGQTPPPPGERRPPAARETSPPAGAPGGLARDPLPAGAVAQFGSLRLQHFTVDRFATFSPDGKLLATGGANSPVCVWDVASGVLVRNYANQGSVLDLRWRADGQLAALSSFRHEVFLMQAFTPAKPDLAPGQSERLHAEASRHERGGPGGAGDRQDRLNYCFLSADGRRAVAVWNRGAKNCRRVAVYRFASAETSDTVKAECELALPDGYGVWLSGDGKRLLAHVEPAGDGPKRIRAYELAAGKDRGGPAWELTLPGSKQDRLDTCFSPDGKRLVLLFQDGRVELWDGPGGKRLREQLRLRTSSPPGFPGGRGIDLSADGKRLVLIDRDAGGQVGGRIIDLETGRQVCRLASRPLPASYWFARFSADGKWVARVGSGVAAVWDARTGAEVCPLPGHRGEVNSLAVPAGGKRVVTAGIDRTVRAWAAGSGKEAWRAVFPEVMEVKFAIPDGPVLVQEGAWPPGRPEGRRALCLDAATGKRRPLPGPLARAKGDVLLACSPDGKQVLTLETGKPAFRLWSWPAGELRTVVPVVPPRRMRLLQCPAAHFTPDGRHFAALVYYSDPAQEQTYRRVPDHSFVETWDAATGRLQRRVELGARGSPVLLPHPSGLYYWGKDGRVCDVVSGRPLVKLGVPEGRGLSLDWVRAAALSPDGQTVAVGTGLTDQHLLLFETRTGRLRAALPAPAQSAAGLSFLPDGRLVSVGATATVWAAGLRPEAGAGKDLDGEWRRLGDPDPEGAWPAMRKLAGAPAGAVALIRGRVRPAPKLSDESLRRIFRGLDADEFEVRQAASRDLDRLGAPAVPRVRAELAGGGSLELKKRLTDFLARHDRGELPPEGLRALRAVEVLEAIATPAARKLLGELAAGEPAARLTREAAAAVQRLRRR